MTKESSDSRTEDRRQEKRSRTDARFWTIVGAIAAVVAIPVGVWTAFVTSDSEANPPLPTSRPASQSPEVTANATTVLTSPATAPEATGMVDAVRITKLVTRENYYVDVTVKVDGPPAKDTKYLLVAQFRGQFQYKAKVPSAKGTHVVPADVRLADPGSWRDFFIVGVGDAATKEWEASADDPMFAMPKGSKELTDWKPHQMPR